MSKYWQGLSGPQQAFIATVLGSIAFGGSFAGMFSPRTDGISAICFVVAMLLAVYQWRQCWNRLPDNENAAELLKLADAIDEGRVFIVTPHERASHV